MKQLTTHLGQDCFSLSNHLLKMSGITNLANRVFFPKVTYNKCIQPPQKHELDVLKKRSCILFIGNYRLISASMSCKGVV